MGDERKTIQVKKVDKKGRVTIPKEIREKEEIEEGKDRVIFTKMPDGPYLFEKR